jgi:hypothetical protein
MTNGLEHFDREIYAIDERIGRLALACGVSLDERANVVALIKGNFTVCRAESNPARHELRALLMMKYQIEERCLATLGDAQCLRLIADGEARLRERGLPIDPLT